MPEPYILKDRFTWFFKLTLVAVIAIVIGLAVHAGQSANEGFAAAGNDEIMRLMSVRNWLAGQPWFDMTQYRILPPEGVSIHWSRYLDVAIAGFIVPLSWYFPMPVAEQIAVIAWPTFLMILLILIVGFGARRMFGSVAGGTAILFVWMWPVTYDFYFSPHQIDHHNIQILMIVIIALAAVWLGAGLLRGIVAGAAAALSLAVGLEALPFLVVIGVVLMLRATFQMAPNASQLLVGFCLALAAVSVVLWLGQTAPEERWIGQCDRLSPPVLGLVGVCVLGCLLPTMLAPIARGPLVSLVIASTVGIAGLGLLWPMIAPCLAGPYGNLPANVQDIINTQIVEALPGLTFAVHDPERFNAIVTPAFGALFIATTFWATARLRGATPDRNLGLLLVLGWLGLAAGLVQIRMVVMAAAAAPILAGYAMSRLFIMYQTKKGAGTAVALLLGILVLFGSALFDDALGRLKASPATTTVANAKPQSRDSDCRSYDMMQALNTLPASTILTPMNLGSLLIWSTHHDGLSAPYHRSAAAYANGVFPFGLPEDDMAKHIANTGADYLLLCAGSGYGDSFAMDLMQGASADWLSRVEVEASSLLVFEILPTINDR